MTINNFLVGSLTSFVLVNGVHLSTNQPSQTFVDNAQWIGAAGDAARDHRADQPSRAQFARKQDWTAELAANAESVIELTAGWDGPGSMPISVEAVSRAMFYVESAIGKQADATAPRLVPGGDGSIQVEWHTRRGELEFDIDDRGEMSIWIRNHLSGAEFDGEGREALALFYRWSPWIAAQQRDASDVPVAQQMATFAFAA